MGERKVINKWYPPDFDPSKIPKRKRPKLDQIKVRMMLPMSVRCLTCGEYLYKGKKFNAKKETVEGEEYLTVKIFRFYLKCTRCSAEFTIKTDPKNSDYACETGVSRNFEPWRERDQAIEEAKAKREKEEEGDAMKALENRTMDSKIEMDILDALDEIKSLNAQHAKVDTDEILAKRLAEQQQMANRLSEEEEKLIADAFSNPDSFVRRLDDEESDAAVDGDMGILKASPLLKPTKKPTDTLPDLQIKPAKKPLLPVISVVAPKNAKRTKVEGDNTTSSFKKPAPVVAPVKVATTEAKEDDDAAFGLVDY